MRSKDIQKSVAKKCIEMRTINDLHILKAYSAYCVALKRCGKQVPLWSEGVALNGVKREIKKLMSATSALSSPPPTFLAQ